ncbi:MAG: tetratricopeptide repeat protein [Candidatus Omnitrophica bacterium]|nr:tetratricopeptide repeat protein [Candidatus Omnitrophota bacterium]
MKFTKSQIDLVSIFLLALISFGLYANSLAGDFLIDDYSVIVGNEKLRDVKSYFSQHFKIRPICLIELINLFLWNISPGSPFFFHVFNVFLHVFCVILIFILCNILFKNSALSFLTSLIFAVHPIHTEAISWISGGHYALSSLFFIASFIFYVKSDKSIVNLMISVLFFVFCFLAGTSVAVLPIMFVLYDVFFREKHKQNKQLRRLRILFLLIIFAMAFMFVAYFVFNKNKFMHLIFYFRGFGYLIVVTKAFVYYLQILYLPLARGLFHPFAYNTLSIQMISPAFFGALIIIVVSIMAFLKCRKNYKPVAFGIMWFFVAYAQYSNVIPICNIVSERYMYLPSLGFAIIMAFLFLKVWEIINRNERHKKMLRVSAISALVLFIGSYSFLTMKRNYDYHDIMSYWQSNINNFKDGYMVYNNLAGTFYAMGDPDNAIAYCWINLLVNPNQPHVWCNLGKVYKEKGDLEQARACYNKALMCDKGYFPALKALEDLKQNE